MARETPDGQQKTEDASAKKLSDARNKGQVAKSIDATSAVILLIGGVIVFLLGPSILEQLSLFMRQIFRVSTEVQLTDTNVIFYYRELIGALALLLLPLLGLIMMFGAIAEISQAGFHFATQKFSDGLNLQGVFNPFQGLQRIFFSAQSSVELLKGIAKMAIVGGIIYQVIASKTDRILSMALMPFHELGPFMAELGYELLWKVGLVYLLIGVGDYFYQRYRFKEEMRMTKQEVKEESKQTEGDQQTKMRIRTIQRQRLRKIMLQRTREADVVITNPTHYAVALQYKQGKMNAPVVLAKGADFLALKMREIATEAGVPIVENPPLARLLYSSLEVDQEIPEDLFTAVAEVLAYVYRLKQEQA